MHCEKCGSADTEVVKCGDCGQKSCVKCANCGFASCTDKYCAAIAIKRKIKILKWAVVIIILVMLGTIPWVYATYKANKEKKNTPVPTVAATPTAQPTKTPVVPTPTKKPPVQPTKAPVPTKVAPPTRTVEAPDKKGTFRSAADFEAAILKVINDSKGIPFKKGGTTKSGMDHQQYIAWAFKQIGWDVPASARKLSTMGTKISKQSDLRPGDVLIFWLNSKTKQPAFMGIYRGGGKFACIIPKAGKGFTVGPLSFNFFKARYMYGQRIYPDLMPK